MKTLQTKQTTPRRFSPASVVLAAMLAASIALGSCTKSEPEPTPTAADGTIRAVASVQRSVELDTKAPNDATSVDGMQVFVFAWNNELSKMHTYGTMTFKSGTTEADAVTFDSGYTGSNFLPFTTSLRISAVLPATGWTMNERGNVFATTIKGCEDILLDMDRIIDRPGNVNDNPSFATLELRHILTRFEISVKAENAQAQAAWGRIKSIAFKKGNGGVFADSVSVASYDFFVEDRQAVSPTQWPTYRITAPSTYTDTPFVAADFASSVTLTTAATPVCYTMMKSFLPKVDPEVVLVITTLDKQGGKEVKTEVPLEIDPATLPSGSYWTQGVAFALNLTFRGNEIVPTATITPWKSTGSGSSEITPSKPYPYVEDGKYIVSRNFKGYDPDAKFHSPWTTTPAHSDTDTDIADAVSNKFEVAQSDATVDGNATMNWYIASGTVDATYNPAPGKKACPDGWRLPTRAELLLMYKQRNALTVDCFVSTNIDAYWSSTYATYVYFSNGSVEGDGPDGSGYVRCVRDIAKPGDYYFTDGTFSSKVESGKTVNGVIYYVDPANPTKFKVMALAEGSARFWAAKNTYTIGAGARSDTDGKANAAAIKKYSEDHTGDTDATTKTTGVFATDFPAAAYCYNYTGKSGTDPEGTWYLPALNELQYLYCAFNDAVPSLSIPARDDTARRKWNALLKASEVGGTGVTEDFFWSSMECSNGNVTYMNFIAGYQINDSKTRSILFIRCVRDL